MKHLVLTTTLLAFSACAPAAPSVCTSNSDCNDGDICAADGTCIAATPVDEPPVGEGEGEGEIGEGEGEIGEGEGEIGEGEGEIGEGEGETPVLDLTPRVVGHGVFSGAGTSRGGTFKASQRLTTGTTRSRGTRFVATQQL